MNTRTLVLTDPPAVVELKRQFRELDAREQQLKAQGTAEALRTIRQSKERIAREIWWLTYSAAHTHP